MQQDPEHELERARRASPSRSSAVASKTSESATFERATLTSWLKESHALTVELTEDLCDRAAGGPRLEIVNPARWEIGHVAWFNERWFLREGLGQASSDAEEDHLYDSMILSHGERWDAPLPRFECACDSLVEIHARVLSHVDDALGDPARVQLLLLTLFHQDMHNEAFAYTRQTHGWTPTPRLLRPVPPLDTSLDADLELAGGTVAIGRQPGQLFAFDNESAPHVRELQPYAISERPVSQGEFLAFVEDDGYRREELWDPGGLKRLRAEGEGGSADSGPSHPLYWRRIGRGWERRRFDSWEPLDPLQAMMHVSWFEARAYARWAGRRLPSEFEWEHAARQAPGSFRTGHTWEWTAERFEPYEGFRTGSYPDYSAPWFKSRRVLRGASWLTPPRMQWPSLRNFYEPHRRDVWCGFRTAAL